MNTSKKFTLLLRKQTRNTERFLVSRLAARHRTVGEIKHEKLFYFLLLTEERDRAASAASGGVPRVNKAGGVLGTRSPRCAEARQGSQGAEQL